MSHITLKRGHTMAPEQLKTEVQALADKLVDKFGGSYRWQGDELHYDFSGGVNACVACAPAEVQVDVQLGMMMSMFKGKIKSEVEEYLENHIS
ncbi:MAG: polyhydroxyalkanoic acid system family protein [Porticoccaceae bacterium]